jgi:hypothetical protein
MRNQIIQFIVLTFIIYIVTCFITLEIDCTKWNFCTRIVFLLAEFFAFIGVKLANW